jgi:ubiquinone/menaquinone biosynthesis C-methylase UbiE
MNVFFIVEELAKEIFKSENDISFCKRVWSTDQSIYQNRLKALGFRNKQKVLDAGFGMMQWSYALLNICKEVYGIEFDDERFKFAQALSKKLQICNFNIFQGSVEKMPFDDGFFDGIFSYSVIMLTDYRKTLNEFYRTLKKGGTLYFNANGLGWYIYNIIEEPNKTNDFSPRSRSIEVLKNTMRYYRGEKLLGKEIMIDKDLLYDDLLKTGFKNILIEGEGKIKTTDYDIKPFFKDTYYNEIGVFEVLCQK